MRRTSAVLASIHAVEPVSIFIQGLLTCLSHRLGSADFTERADGFSLTVSHLCKIPLFGARGISGFEPGSGGVVRIGGEKVRRGVSLRILTASAVIALPP